MSSGHGKRQPAKGAWAVIKIGAASARVRLGREKKKIGVRVGRGYRDAVRKSREQRLFRRDENGTSPHTDENFLFGFGNHFTTAEVPDMRRSDVGNECHIRSDGIRESRDLSSVIHSRLQDKDLGVRRRREHGHRNADFVVMIFLGSEDVIFFRKNGGKKLFRRRFSDTAGDGDDASQVRETEAVGTTETEEGVFYIRYRDSSISDMATERDRTFGDRLVRIEFSVRTFALQSEEEITPFCVL